LSFLSNDDKKNISHQYKMSLIPSTDCFATGDPASSFFLRNGQPIATPSPLQILSADAEVVASVGLSNAGVLTIGIDGAALAEVVITQEVTVDSLVATGLVQASTIDAAIVSSRLVTFTSTVGIASITVAIPGMTVTGTVFAQQVNNGEQAQPVVAGCNVGSVTLAANAPMTANTVYKVYVASLS
jgi:hypothetical protein